ncbi:hypothetical protein NC651_015339 [Populus alba x Populus x berolinensis]|nr:hypothetical protein NC651_015339 [Populus alba x Populus x berolinensis]
MLIVQAPVLKVVNHKHIGISLAQFPSFASVNAYAHRPIFISLHQPKISHLHQPPTPPAQNPYVPPNSGDQGQKCHEAVPGILRCAFELVSSLSNPKFEISADCCSVVKVVEENCLAQAWVPYISTGYSLSISNSIARNARLWSHC